MQWASSRTVRENLELLLGLSFPSRQVYSRLTFARESSPSSEEVVEWGEEEKIARGLDGEIQDEETKKAKNRQKSLDVRQSNCTRRSRQPEVDSLLGSDFFCRL